MLVGRQGSTINNSRKHKDCSPSLMEIGHKLRQNYEATSLRTHLSGRPTDVYLLK